MMLRKYLFPSILLFWLILGHSESLQAQITENTYQRAAYFLTGNLEKQVYHLEVVPNWLEGSQGFVHATFTSEGKRFYKTNTSPFETTAAFDPPVLAKLLQEKTGEVIDQANLPIERVFLSNGKTVTFLWKNQNWTWNMENNSLNAIPVTERNEMESFSPDRKWKAFSRNYNLFIKNLTTGEEIQLSTDGRKDFEYASFWGWSDLIYGENGERPAHFMVNWSPDSRKIFTQIVDLRIAEKMYLLDWSKDEKFRPELLSYFRGSPGDSTVVNYIPVIFDLEKKTEKKLPELTAPHFIGINLRWSDDGKKTQWISNPPWIQTIPSDRTGCGYF